MGYACFWPKGGGLKEKNPEQLDEVEESSMTFEWFSRVLELVLLRQMMVLFTAMVIIINIYFNMGLILDHAREIIFWKNSKTDVKGLL